jgi:hypothetical protein
MLVKEILKKYLIIAGYDGLYFPGKCECDIKNLAPCCNNFSECQPGYYQSISKKKKGKNNFIIGKEKRNNK